MVGPSLPNSEERPLDGQTQTWLRDAKAGGVAEFSRLYEHVAPAVFAWARIRLNRDSRTEIDAQDLVQEVWLRAWRSLEDFDEENTPFRRWIFRVGKLVLLELLRDGARRRYAEIGSDTRRAVLNEHLDPATAISQRVARDDALHSFVAAVEAMPEPERKLVTYCGLEGLSYAEAANRLDSSTAAVARRWQRLRHTLAEGGLPMHLFDESIAR